MWAAPVSPSTGRRATGFDGFCTAGDTAKALADEGLRQFTKARLCAARARSQRRAELQQGIDVGDGWVTHPA